MSAECMGCLDVAPLLMPVEICTAYGDGEIHLCVNCRLGWQDEEHVCLASTIRHLPNGDRE